MEGALLALSLALLAPRGLHGGGLTTGAAAPPDLWQSCFLSRGDVVSPHHCGLDWKEGPGGVSLSGFLGHTVLFIDYIISKCFTRWRWATGGAEEVPVYIV